MTKTDIDALARLLDGDPTVNGEASDETRALASFALAMQATARVPRPEFKADLRASLIGAAREQAANPPLLTRMRRRVDDTTARWRYSTRVAAATGAAAMALSGGGAAVAAERALPGDTFYGVKLTLEDVRLALIRDPAARGAQALAYAAERLSEAQQVVAAGNVAAAERALREADESARAGAGLLLEASGAGNADALGILEQFSEEQRTGIESLLPHLDGPSAQAGPDALTSLDRIDARLGVLTGACDICDAAADTPGADPTAVDMTAIPPASEPFRACPCTEPAGSGSGDSDGRTGDRRGNKAGKGDKAPAKNRQQPTDASGGGSGDEQPSGEAPREEPAPQPQPQQQPRVPKTGNQTVDDAGKVVDDVIDDVIEDLPVKPPSVPVKPPSVPKLPLPSELPKVPTGTGDAGISLP